MVAANRADIAFAIQSAKGTPAAEAAFRTFITGGRQPGQIRTDEPFDETTDQRQYSESYASEAHVDGSPSIYAMPKMLAGLLYSVLGGNTTTGAADPFTHTIIPAASLPYLTFWSWLADLVYQRSSDCKVTQLVLHGESGKPLTVTVTVMGLLPVVQTAHETTVAVERIQRFMHYNGAGALQVEGVAASSIRSFDLTINNNGQIIPGDDFTPHDIAETRLDVSLRTTQLVQNAALWNRIHYGSASPANNDPPSREVLELAGSPAGIDFKWTRVPAAPGPERSLRVQIPLVTALPFDLTASPAPEPLVQEVTYNAYQPASGASITAIVKNDVATL